MSSSKQPSLGQIAQSILQDAIQNIIHDTVIQKHREHKQLLNTLDVSDRLPHCRKCKLPRLLDPPLAAKVRGATSDPAKDTVYCDRKPWSRRPGHDIYDNPFPKSDVTGRPPTKKEREAAKNKKEAGDGTPVSEEANANGTAPPSPSAEGDNTPTTKTEKLEKGEKKASKIDEKLRKGEYVPWHTCPSCKRSLLITRFAKHLEQCMGISGRAASRNAMAKMNGSTPSGSRGATPNPSQENHKPGENDDEEDDIAVKGSADMKKKLLKKGLSNKIKKEKKKDGGEANGEKIPKSLSSATTKNPPSSNATAHVAARASPALSSTTTEKRERDETGDGEEDEENVHVKKRQKLQRVGSTASIASTSTVAPSAVDMERGDSNDGSFLDDASNVDE